MLFTESDEMEIYSPSLIPELACSNLDESLLFYTEVLGFVILYQRPEEGFAMLERQMSRVMLDQVTLGTNDINLRTWIAAPLEKPYGRGVNLQIRTDDVQSLYNHVQVRSKQIFLPIEDKWYRVDDVLFGSRQFIILDPDGYLLRFFESLGERPTATHINS